jgi:hypothetical protein
MGVRGQSISSIETTKNWYYIYDQDEGQEVTYMGCRRSWSMASSVPVIVVSSDVQSIKTTTM